MKGTDTGRNSEQKGGRICTQIERSIQANNNRRDIDCKTFHEPLSLNWMCNELVMEEAFMRAPASRIKGSGTSGEGKGPPGAQWPEKRGFHSDDDVRLSLFQGPV